MVLLCFVLFFVILSVQWFTWLIHNFMMTSSNGNIFCVTGPLCGEFTGHRWIPLTKASDVELWCFLWSAWINSWVNNRKAGDLRRHHSHYDVTVMLPILAGTKPYITKHSKASSRGHNLWYNINLISSIVDWCNTVLVKNYKYWIKIHKNISFISTLTRLYQSYVYAPGCPAFIQNDIKTPNTLIISPH